METATNVAAPTPKPSFIINRNFGLLWIGQAISSLGDMIYFVTLSLWIATVIAQGQLWAPAAVSGVMIAAALPTLTLGPFAGVFVDRWDKRLTMVRMDMIRAVLILMLIPLTGLMPLPFVSRPLPALWQISSIYIVVLAASICRRFFDPARFTILSEILPEPQRARASAMEQTSGSVVKIIGPFLAAPLLFVVGVQWALIVNALSFVVSFLAILAVRVLAGGKERSAKTERTNFLRELKEGLTFYRESRLMLTLLISILIVTLGSGALDALLVFFFQKNLHAPTSLFGTLPMAIGAGSVPGAILSSLLVRRLGSARVFRLSLYLVGLLLILFARQNMLWPALVLLCLAGLHTNLLGMSFGAYDTIYVVTGLLFLLGAFYAMINLRGMKLAEHE